MSFENQFKDLFNNTTDLIQFVGVDGNIELVNASWLNIMGYELYEVAGHSIYDFVHPEHTEKFKQERQKAMVSRKTEEIKTVYISKKGNPVFVEGNITAFFKDEKPVYTNAVLKDISQWHLAEKKLAENEKRLNTFFTQAPDAVIVIDEEQHITEWNPKAEAIFGFTANEVIGTKLSETIIPIRYRDAHIKGMQHFLKTGEGPVLNHTIEIAAIHKNGNEFFINLSISGVKLADQWMFIAFLSDISERKKTEEMLIHREAELLQAKFLEEKKNEFISIASHELKTPLTTIKAYTQLALMSSAGTPGKGFEYLKKVEQFTNKLNSLVDELLDVSKIEGGKLKLSVSPTDFNIYLQQALHSLQHITPGHIITLQHNAVASINIDPLRLEQVISNIISNAAKYSPGKNQIIVNSVIENNWLQVSFKDFGIGIPGKDMQHVFNRFYRVNESSGRFSGLGIGLYISAEIIKRHGGKIWVESEPGIGSTFYFSLPLENK